MKALKLSLLYFGVVFAAGFALGTIRVLWLIPRLGVRSAELLEIPIMVLVSMAAARWIIGKHAVPSAAKSRLAIGIPALVILLFAEFGVAVGLRGMTVVETIASRDPVSGPLYYISLVLFGLMPLLVCRTAKVPVLGPHGTIDRFIDNPDVAECHEIVVNAPVDLVFRVATNFDLLSVPAVHATFKLREAVMGVRPQQPRKPRGIIAETTALGWGELAFRPGREIVMGAVTQPWIGDVKFTTIASDHFADFSEPNFVKIAWTLEAEPIDPVTTRFRTQTRVLATDEAARRRFRRYWLWAGKGIVLIRLFSNRAIRREAERQASSHKSWPVLNPNYSATLTRTIDTPLENVWPWLVQMGYRRGGLYSYDWLDRVFGYLDAPSAEQILPQFQKLTVGDVVPIGRGGGFPIKAVEPYQRLVLGGDVDGFRWIWQLELCAIGVNRTRLTSRNSAQAPRSLKTSAFLRILRPAAFIMTRKMLLGIKHRAERITGEYRPEAKAS